MATNVGNLDTKLKITVDPETGKITSVVTELKNVKKASDDSTASIVKGLAIWESLTQVVGFAVDAFKAGVTEIKETEAATSRLQTAAQRAGIDFASLNTMAANLAQDGLIQMDEAMQNIADLAQAGFGKDQIEALAPAFKDLAASIGGDVSNNMDILTTAIVKGKAGGEELAKMLPSLKNELAKAGIGMKELADGTNAAEVRQAIINATLKDSVAAAGASEKAVNSLSGQMQIFDNTVADLQETFATGLINSLKETSGAGGDLRDKMMQMEPAIKDLGTSIGWLIGQLTKLPGAIKTAATQWGEWYDDVVKLAGAPFGVAGNGMNLLTDRAKTLGKATFEGRTQNIQYGESVDIWAKAAKDAGLDLEHLSAKHITNAKAAKADAVEAEKLQKKADELAKSIREWGGSVEDTGKKMQGLQANLEVMSPAISDWTTRVIASASATKAWEDSLGVVDTVDELKNSLGLLAPATELYSVEFGVDIPTVTKKAKDSVEELGSALYALADLMGNIFGPAVGELIGTLGDMAKSFKAIKTDFTSGFKDLGKGFGAGAGGFDFGSVLSGITSLASGIGSAIQLGMQLFSVLKKIFGHDWEKDTKNQLSLAGFDGLSDQLTKQITETAKKIGDANTAVFLHLTDIASELGVTQENAQQFFDELLHGFDLADQGFITTQQLAEQLAGVFPQLADLAVEFGGTFIDQLGAVIDKMKETGIGMDTLQAYFDQLQAKIDEIRGSALTDLISQVNGLGDAFAAMMAKLKAKGNAAAGGHSDDWMSFLDEGDLNRAKSRFDEMERYFTETVADMQAQGMSMQEIFKQLGPLWDQLAQAAKDFGFETSKEFQDLSRTMELMKKFQGAFAKLDFISNIAKDEARLGVLTQKTFEDLEQSTFATFKRMAEMSREQILAAANSGKPLTDQAQAALQATLPYLIQVIGMHNQMGLAISKNDQAMIKLAQDMGLLPDDLSAVGLDPTLAALDNMLEVLKLIAEALGVSADAIAGIGDAMGNTADAWNEAVNRMLPIPVPGGHDYNPNYHRLPPPGNNPPGYGVTGGTTRSSTYHVQINVPPGVVRDEYELARFVGNEIDRRSRQNRQ